MALGIKVGDTYSFSKKVSNEDVFSFAEVSGDKNPLHLDDEYAKNTMFKGRIAHGCPTFKRHRIIDNIKKRFLEIHSSSHGAVSLVGLRGIEKGASQLYQNYGILQQPLVF